MTNLPAKETLALFIDAENTKPDFEQLFAFCRSYGEICTARIYGFHAGAKNTRKVISRKTHTIFQQAFRRCCGTSRGPSLLISSAMVLTAVCKSLSFSCHPYQ